MKKIFISAFTIIISILIVQAQSLESDRLFAIGVEKYNAGDYREAIGYFGRVDSLDTAELDSLSIRGGYSKEWIAACWYKIGDIERAKTFNDYYYLPPVDRRLTVETDSLQMLAWEAFDADGPQAALELLHETLQKESLIFGEDHYWLTGTIKSIALVYGTTSDVDKTSEYMKRYIELCRKWNGEDYDFSDDYLYMCNLLISAGRYDECKRWLVRGEECVLNHYGTDNDKYDEIFSFKFYLCTIDKEWDKAEKLIKDYRKILERRYGKHSVYEKNLLTNITNHYEQAGRAKEAAYYRKEISKFGKSALDEGEARLNRLLAEYGATQDYIESGNYKKAIKKYDDIMSETKNLTDSVSRTCYWFSKASKSWCLTMTKKKNDDPFTFDDYIQSKREIGEMSYIVGFFYVIAEICGKEPSSREYDTALAVLNEVVPPLLAYSNSNQVLGHNHKSQFALIYALLGQTSQSRRLSAEAKADYMRLIEAPNATHSYDKVSKDLNSQLTMMGTYIREEDNRYFSSNQPDNYLRHDSISYAAHKVRANMLECKLLLDLKTKDGKYSIPSDISDYYSDIVIYCCDSITAKAFMSDYLEKIIEKFGKDDGSHLYTEVGYYYARIFPKGSQEGKVLYEDLLAVEKKTDGYWYDRLLEDYYEFIDDKDALVRLKTDRLTGSPSDILSSKFYIYSNAGMRDDAIEAIEGYLSLYPGGEKPTYMLDRMVGYLLTESPDAAYMALSELLDKAEKSGDKDFMVYIMFNILTGRVLNNCPEETKEDFRQFISRQIETRPAFNDDPSLLLHLKLYETFLYDSKDVPAMLSLLQLRKSVSPRDYAELIYTSAMWNANRYYNPDIEELKSVIAYFECNEELMNTAEYKTLLITLSEKLPEGENPTELVAIYDKIGSLNPTEQLCTDFLKHNGLRQNLFSSANDYLIMMPLHREYAETIDFDKYTRALENSGRTADLKPMLVKILGNRLNQISNDLKRSYIDWEDTAGKASELAGTLAQYATRYSDVDSLAVLAYDSSMLCKGMLLRAEGGLFSVLATSDHASISKKFETLQELKERLEQAQREGAATEGLQRQYNRTRREMVDLANRLGNFTSSLQHTSMNVASKLSGKDVAIEFMTSTDDTETTTYYAAILRADGTPRLIRLCTGDELQAVSSPYTTDEVFRLVWCPIEELLSSGKSGADTLNIYFAPTGAMHQLAVEYVPTSDGQLISQRHNIYRLSNTAELLKAGAKGEKAGQVTLYGGIMYEDGNIPLIPVAGKRGAVADLEYLPGTREEVMSISRELEGSDYDVTVVTGSEATEMSVKELSGSGISALHLATHGFYTPQERRGTDSGDTDPLTHSGLYMAGASETLSGYGTGDTDNDGILTAKDIADLDFSDADLVVLSACQTALGEISDEGVFGLQRGFKKAGVGSLLMSLWPVDDEATRILMTRFYHNLTNNLSKREALQESQEYLRTVDDGYYDDPEYWAAFILLDAVNFPVE